MPIQVTCPKCHTRFNVSEKFAGKEGPCPKCKTKIRVPSKSEEVVISAPKSGPTDSEGREILKPIKRAENRLSQIQIGLIVAALVGFLATAFFFRLTVEDKINFPFWILAVSAIVIAPPVALGAYTILKDSELEDFKGKSLWMRVLISGAIYALFWLAMPLAKYAFGDQYEMGTWILALVGMLGGGAAVGMLTFDFDYLTGLLHYGLYLGFCLLGRLIAGIGVLPGMLEKPEPVNSGFAMDLLHVVQRCFY